MTEKKVYLAGGCFWGMQELFRKQPGIITTRVGYTGGTNKNPTYEHHPGHAEVIEITYDTNKTDYEHILNFFFQIHNPTTKNKQGNDIGESYRSAIFYQNKEEQKQAKTFIQKVNEAHIWEEPAVTTLEPYKEFWEAENYHQDYLQKNPNGYTCHYIRKKSIL